MIAEISHINHVLSSILVIKFWNFTVFWFRSNSPQVRRNIISIITNLAYELPHGLWNGLRLTILRNYEVLEKSQLRLKTA